MSNSSKSAEPTDATEVRFSIRAMLIVMAVVAVATSALTAFIRPFPTDLRTGSHSTGALWRCSSRRCLYSTRGDAEGRK